MASRRDLGVLPLPWRLPQATVEGVDRSAMEGEGLRVVKVQLQYGEEEELALDGERGPLFVKTDGSLELSASPGCAIKGGPMGPGRRKAWRHLSNTEREYVLISAAKRQQALRRAHLPRWLATSERRRQQLQEEEKQELSELLEGGKERRSRPRKLVKGLQDEEWYVLWLRRLASQSEAEGLRW
mmetsp:Transcript_82747/g.242731  ORF Transcript_82747/g.242731 Transcript_82747/m.242731 type:complete len:184 (+) Transcript_82747:38-589(+)